MLDQRASKRLNCEVPINIDNFTTGKIYEGTLYNYSREGMYLELDYPLKPRSEIHILIEKENDLCFPKCCQARVVWCEEITGAVVLYNYGIGVLNDSALKFSNVAERFQVIDGGANK